MIKFLNNILIGISLLLVLFTMPLMAENSGYCEVESILTGVNTDPAHPGLYLIDGDPGTSWSFKPSASRAWAEVKLEERILIRALEIEGYLASETELKMEYYRDGSWRPFLAPTTGELNGSSLIDLSADRVAADRLRLQVTGNGLAGSYLGELKILGVPVREYYHQLKPVEITASDNTDPVYKAEFLADGNTYTLWKTEKESKGWQ